MRMDLSLQIILAFALDLLLGDPRDYPHPVRLIGRAAAWMEIRTRAWFRDPLHAGGVTAATIILGTFAVCWALLAVLGALHPTAETCASVFLIYTCISARGLYDESQPVKTHLQRGGVAQARKSLAHIVGRDTENLDRQGIVRATVETIAENTVDGVIAPLFYACLGGAPLALAYKAVNTLDSLFGYKNERYLRFGRIPARIDDAANWLPARLAAPILAFSCAVCGNNPLQALRTVMRDGSKHASPNAGIPEAAVAGALGIRLGGSAFYGGRKTDKPWIGSERKEIEIEDITAAHRILAVASLSAVLLFVSMRVWILHY